MERIACRRSRVECRVSSAVVVHCFRFLPKLNTVEQRGAQNREQTSDLARLSLPLAVSPCLSVTIQRHRYQESIFSLQSTNKYTVRRDTRARGIVADIPYWVSENFNARYARDPRSLRMVEQNVEQEYEYKLRSECYAQKEQQHRLMYQVSNTLHC